MKFNSIYKVILIVVFVAFSLQMKAQKWTVPEEDSKVICPKPFSTTTARSGKDLFNAKCKSCHGAVGTNSSLPLNPEPGDPASEKFSKQSDGDLFYKMTKGRGTMPSFQSQLSEEDRWNIISYIRTFHKDYVPASGEGIVEEDDSFKGTNLKFSVHFNPASFEVITDVQGELDGKTISASGVRLGYFVKRNFGLLSIGNIVTTNAKGVAKVQFPKDLPGDSLGKYEVVIKVIDEDLYGKVEYKETIAWGKPFVYKNPLDHRAMWGNRTNAPLWLLISYFAVVGLVWSVIFWVVFQMLKLKKQV